MGKNKKNKKEKFKIAEQQKNYAGIYLKIIKIGIFLALLLPLLIIPSQLYLFQFGKVAVFRVIVEIIAIFYILLIAKEEKYRPKWGLLEISIAVFVAIYFITSLLGVNFWRSFWGTMERMGGFYTFIHYWIFFVIASSIFKNKEEWKKLFVVSVFVSVLSSLYAVAQSFYFTDFLIWLKEKNSYFYDFFQKYAAKDFLIIIDDYRSFGTIGNAGPFASYILFNLFFGIYLLFSKSKIYLKLFFLILLAITSGGMLVSGTRGAYLAAAGGVVTLILICIYFSSAKKSKVFISIILVTMICLIGYIWLNKESKWVTENYILSRFTTISFKESTSRFWTWESAEQSLKDKPLTGYGPENFNIAFNKYFNPLHFIGYGSVTWYDRAHNIIFEILTTMGAVGLINYLGIFVALYYILLKNYRRARENLAAFGLIFSIPVAYFVQNMFWFDDFSTYLMLFIFLAFASSFFNNTEGFNVEFGRIESFKTRISKALNLNLLWRRINDNLNIVYAAAILLAIVSIYYGNIKPWNFHDRLTLASAAFAADSNDSFSWYRDAMKNSSYLGRYEAYKRFGEYVINTYAIRELKSKNDQKVFKDNLDFTISELKKAIAENPRDAQFYLLLGRLYNKTYSYFREPVYLDEGEKIFKKGLELSPKRQTLLYEYGQSLVFKKDYAKAAEIFRYAKDLYPDVPISHWYLGMALANAGNFSEAKSEVEKATVLGYGYKTMKDIFNLAPIYAGLKDYKKVESLYIEALDLEPNNPQIYVLLAITYKELGDKENAQKMAEKAISLDPSFIAEGKKFIEELK